MRSQAFRMGAFLSLGVLTMNHALPSTFGSQSRPRIDIDEVDLRGQGEQCLSQGLRHDVARIAIHAARVRHHNNSAFRLRKAQYALVKLPRSPL
jgi:hypothetical protein